MPNLSSQVLLWDAATCIYFYRQAFPPVGIFFISSIVANEMIEFWFQCYSHSPMIRHQLWTFWANLNRRWTSTTSLERRTRDVVFPQNLAVLEQSSLPNVSCRICKNHLAGAERYANISSVSTIIRNHFLHCFNGFIGC